MRTLGLADPAFIGGMGGGVQLWTPAAITTALWLDAADASTITTVSGAVSQWNDKSGNARHATQGTPAARPLIAAAAQNGLDVVRFDGSNDTMEFDSSFLTGTRAFNVFCIFARRGSGTDAYSPTLGQATQSGVGNVGALHYIKSDLKGASYPNSPLWEGYDGNGSYANDRFYTMEFLAETTSYRVLIDQVQEGSGSTAGTNIDSVNTRTRIASHGGTNRFSRNDYAEILMTNQLSLANRERVQGYLAHKWGLTANLPSDHPFKLSAPTT